MSRSSIWFCAAVLSPLIAQGQHRVGPVYPENETNTHSWSSSGYDPFHFNWTTGRWDYVPIPYDVHSGPFAFNWHTGRWDYSPSYSAPSDIYSGREPERNRPEGSGPAVATVPARQIPSVDNAVGASATLKPAQPASTINRPAPMRRAFNYTTSDPNFDDWYRSTSK
jgi:hypothetical protein